MSELSQKERLLLFVLYVSALVALSVTLTGALPRLDSAGYWFYSGLAMLALGGLIAQPFFTKPSDAIANAVAGMLGIGGLARQDSAFDGTLSHVLFWFFATVLVVAALAVAFLPAKDLPKDRKSVV